MELYKKIYEIIGELTPLDTDCGAVCGGACCMGDEDTGMYLFPGEEALFSDTLSFGKKVSCDFTYTLNGAEMPVTMFICDGTCDRSHRPLSCRIFPFAFYTGEDGAFEVRLDPRADFICPLADNPDGFDFNNEFLDALEKAFELLLEDENAAAFIYEQSRLLDDFFEYGEEI